MIVHCSTLSTCGVQQLAIMIKMRGGDTAVKKEIAHNQSHKELNLTPRYWVYRYLLNSDHSYTNDNSKMPTLHAALLFKKHSS